MATKPNLYRRFKTDKKAKENGTPVDFGDGVVFLIRSAGSTVVRAVDDEINKENRPLIKAGLPIPLETLEKQAIRRATAIIAGFVSGATDEAGNEMEYTPTNAQTLMTDLEELREMVIGAGYMHETFRAAQIKDVTENLSRASASISGTQGAAAQIE
jgi:hypothetical protein